MQIDITNLWCTPELMVWMVCSCRHTSSWLEADNQTQRNPTRFYYW